MTSIEDKQTLFQEILQKFEILIGQDRERLAYLEIEIRTFGEMLGNEISFQPRKKEHVDKMTFEIECSSRVGKKIVLGDLFNIYRLGQRIKTLNETKTSLGETLASLESSLQLKKSFTNDFIGKLEDSYFEGELNYLNKLLSSSVRTLDERTRYDIHYPFEDLSNWTKVEIDGEIGGFQLFPKNLEEEPTKILLSLRW
jgi:hypothetical protein